VNAAPSSPAPADDPARPPGVRGTGPGAGGGTPDAGPGKGAGAAPYEDGAGGPDSGDGCDGVGRDGTGGGACDPRAAEYGAGYEGPVDAAYEEEPYGAEPYGPEPYGEPPYPGPPAPEHGGGPGGDRESGPGGGQDAEDGTEQGGSTGPDTAQGCAAYASGGDGSAVEVLGAVLAAVARLDLEGVLDHFAGEAVCSFPYAPPGLLPAAHGRNEIRALLAAAAAPLSDFEVTDFQLAATDDPELAIALVGARSRYLGRPYANRYVMTARVREGRIVSYEEYFGPDALLAALAPRQRLLLRLALARPGLEWPKRLLDPRLRALLEPGTAAPGSG
jgi:uncharacterized protein